MGMETNHPTPTLRAAAPDPLWTINDVATFLRCTVRHVHNMMPAGLPHFYLGRLLRFDPNEVRSHLQKRRRVNVA
jgi:hypothetical protein